MIPSVIPAYIAAANNSSKKRTSMPHVSTPIFETIDEARQSLIKEQGPHEYYIREDPISISRFKVSWITDNKIYELSYEKKVTGIRK